MTTSDRGELGLPSSKLLFSLLIVVLGLQGAAAVATGLGAVTAGIEAAQAFAARRDSKRLRRLERLISSLDRRLHGLEIDALPEERVDLFIEVVRKAVEDDEERKLPFYEAVLDWLAKHKPTAAQVRVLSDAVQRLSYVELFAFASELRGGLARPTLDGDGLPETAYVHRLESTGIANGGVRYNGSPTLLGQALSDHLAKGVLVAPNRRGQDLVV